MFDLVPRCQVSRCPPLLFGPALSSLAMSVPTILMVSRCPVPRFQSPQPWDGSGGRGAARSRFKAGPSVFIGCIIGMFN